MASQLLQDPPIPDVMRREKFKFDSPSYEIAHLTGIGQYGCDAWRLFCKKHFYMQYGREIEDPWKSLEVKDKILQRYVKSKRDMHVLIAETGALTLDPKEAMDINRDRRIDSTPDGPHLSQPDEREQAGDEVVRQTEGSSSSSEKERRSTSVRTTTVPQSMEAKGRKGAQTQVQPKRRPKYSLLEQATLYAAGQSTVRD